MLSIALPRRRFNIRWLWQQVSTPFRAELEAADAKEKAVLAEHLETVDKVSRFKGQDMLVVFSETDDCSCPHHKIKCVTHKQSFSLV